MSLAFPDRVIVTPVTRTAAFNDQTEGTSTTYRASIEVDNRIVYGNDGAPIEPAMTILLPKDAVVNKGDFVQVSKLHGTDPTAHESAQRLVKQARRIGGSRISHVEVIV